MSQNRRTWLSRLKGPTENPAQEMKKSTSITKLQHPRAREYPQSFLGDRKQTKQGDRKTLNHYANGAITSTRKQYNNAFNILGTTSPNLEVYNLPTAKAVCEQIKVIQTVLRKQLEYAIKETNDRSPGGGRQGSRPADGQAERTPGQLFPAGTLK